MDATWRFRESVNTEHVFEFLLCVVDITDILTNLKGADKASSALIAMSAARRISVPLRKLFLDGNGHLFKNCFAEPNLHPLKPPSPNDRPVTFVQKFNRPTMELGFADGKRTTVQIPEYEQRTTVHPLYGVRHESGQTFIFDMPFNTDARPQKFKAWMNTKVLQIDDLTFTARDLLREIANNEGAHFGESKKLAMPDASSLTFDNVKNQRYKAVNTVKFGGLSYAQNFVICTGLYIADRSKTILDHLPFSEPNEAIDEMCKKILGSPSKISGRGEMENQTYHGVVLDHDLNVRPESIGVYSTLLKIT